MVAKDAELYGSKKSRNLTSGKELTSATTLSFTSQLSSLITASKSDSTTSSAATSARARPSKKKDDLFTRSNRNSAKRAKRDLDPDYSAPFTTQHHTTDGEALDPALWARSQRKMEAKARLYAAMKRGDVEDADERYAVDFDQKWADARAEGRDLAEETDDSDADGEGADAEQVEYVDEFGRTRTGSKSAAARAMYAAQRAARRDGTGVDDGTAARPLVEASRVIYGDTIQYQAFDPDAPRVAQMAALAAKRDRSLTPPPESHFDASREVRTKGTGFFQFSTEGEERKQQMENLEQERAETERKRAEREEKLDARRRMIEERRAQLAQRSAKREADAFLEELGKEIGVQHDASATSAAPDNDNDDHDEHEDSVKGDASTAVTSRIEAAIQAELDDA